MLTFTIGDGSRDVNEATNYENGIIKILGSDLIDLFGTRTNIEAVSLFASPKKALDSITPSVSDIPEGVDEIPLLRFDLDSDGKIDEEDYFLALC
ncbi:unnamed protein product, partial [marine sediment metagenome]